MFAGSLVWAAYNKAKGTAHSGEEAGSGSATRPAAQWDSFFDHDVRVRERIDDEYLVCVEAESEDVLQPTQLAPNENRSQRARMEGWRQRAA